MGMIKLNDLHMTLFIARKATQCNMILKVKSGFAANQSFTHERFNFGRSRGQGSGKRLAVLAGGARAFQKHLSLVVGDFHHKRIFTPGTWNLMWSAPADEIALA
ncbi:MAG: hypothetical protein GX155_00405, partial [Smithella sp.]|nr:hypothetical protein [Smithella sp.]